ncbi:MAG TPA: YraN family protein [Candidatus Omnitrophota bacterium]|nr:YraN family protein [Candidatus Omnitrophota bacterium]
MCTGSLEFGRLAENTAVKFLKTKGYKILERNYRNKFGEIDIIAKHKGVVCFLEVKARNTVESGLPQEAVTARKQNQISKVAVDYLKSNNLLEHAARFDVVGILYLDHRPQISLITNAFELTANFTI